MLRARVELCGDTNLTAAVEIPVDCPGGPVSNRSYHGPWSPLGFASSLVSLDAITRGFAPVMLFILWWVEVGLTAVFAVGFHYFFFGGGYKLFKVFTVDAQVLLLMTVLELGTWCRCCWEKGGGVWDL